MVERRLQAQPGYKPSKTLLGYHSVVYDWQMVTNPAELQANNTLLGYQSQVYDWQMATSPAGLQAKQHIIRLT
jgi:hypothetical protein